MPCVYKWIEKGRREKADIKKHQGHAETDKGKKRKKRPNRILSYQLNSLLNKNNFSKSQILPIVLNICNEL